MISSLILKYMAEKELTEKEVAEKMNIYITEFRSIQKERNEKYIAYLKNAITMAVGFLGIMLSLADTEKMNYTKHLFYSSTITLTVLGILVSLIMTFYEIKALTVIRNKIYDNAYKLLSEKKEGQFPEFDTKWTKTLHFFWVFFFVCALVSATLYSWF